MTTTDSTKSSRLGFLTPQLMQSIKSYAWTVLKFSWVMIGLGAAMGYWMRNRKLDSPTMYTADYSFAINREATQNQQNIASLFGGSSGVGEENVNFKKLRELVLTRQVSARVLFDTITLYYEQPNEPDLLINHYLNIFHYSNQTEEQAANNFYFKSDSIDPFDRKSNSLLRSAHAAIRGYLVLEPSPAGFMHMKATTSSEDFSYELVHAWYRALDSYYSEEASRQKERYYEMAKERAAELRSKLDGAEQRYIIHLNTNGAEAKGRNNTLIKTQFLSSELTKATQSYFTAVANAEAAKVAFEEQRQTPSIIEVDPPLYPLPKIAPNPFLHMIAGSILGAALGFFLIIGVRFVLDWRRNQRLKGLPEEED